MKAKEAALRIGQAAAQLAISSHHLRQLCKCGLVEAELSPGGQWRVPLTEIRRLQNEGVPAAPTFIEDDPLPRAPNPLPAANRPGSPSPHVVDAFEDAEIEEAAVRKEEATVRRKESTVRKLRLQLEELDAQGRVDAQVADRQGAALQVEEGRLHAAWVEQCAQFTLGGLRPDVPGTLRLALYNAIADRLAGMPRTQSDVLTQQLIDAEKDKILEPLERQRKVHRVVESVCGDLPIELRCGAQNQVKKNQAAQAARSAIEQLGDVPEGQMKLAATAAVNPFVKDFEHERRCAQLPLELPWGLTSDERAEAREQVRAALSQLPASATLRELEVVRDNALTPFRFSLAKREHKECRERLIANVSLAFSLVMSNTERESALQEVRDAIASLPVGASEQEMKAARDRVSAEIWKKRERKSKISMIIERGLREICPYVQKLVQTGRLELERLETVSSVAESLKNTVRQGLENDLDGAETEEDVKRIVREIIRDEFDI
jgi:hypothetical protein